MWMCKHECVTTFLYQFYILYERFYIRPVNNTIIFADDMLHIYGFNEMTLPQFFYV